MNRIERFLDEFADIEKAKEWVDQQQENEKRIVTVGKCQITEEDLAIEKDEDEVLCNFIKKESYSEIHYFHDSVIRPIKCRNCGKWFDSRSEGVCTEDTSNWFCDECKDEFLYVCRSCGGYLEENYTEIEGDFYCDECRDEHFTECEDCGDWVGRDYVTRTNDDRYICESCYENNYFTCQHCDEVFHNDDYAEDGLCRNCYDESNYPVHDYHYGRRNCIYRPRRLGNELNKDLLFGVELECEKGRLEEGRINEWIDDDNLIHFEHDGSLCNGVELITQPCTLEFHQKKMRWKELCETMLRMGYRSHDARNCGLHVHISRDALLPSQIVKMDVLLNRYYSRFWRFIARRDSNHYSVVDENKVANVLVGYNSEFEVQRPLYDKMIERKKNMRVNKDRYQIFNISNSNTIEIRMSKGSLNYETVLGTIETYHALVNFVKNVSWYDLYDVLTLRKRFVKYLFGNDMYQNAEKMMRRLFNGSNILSEYYSEE